MFPRILIGVSRVFKQCEVPSQITSNKRFIHSTVCWWTQRRFTDKHEWVEVDGKVGTIGISEYAQEALGDVVFAQLPDINVTLKQKDECGALESVKAASEIFTPVSGKVIAINKEVEEAPSLINKSCYEKGWLFKVELTDETEVEKLMTEDEYKKFLTMSDEH